MFTAISFVVVAGLAFGYGRKPEVFTPTAIKGRYDAVKTWLASIFHRS